MTSVILVLFFLNSKFMSYWNPVLFWIINLCDGYETRQDRFDDDDDDDVVIRMSWKIGYARKFVL